MVAFRRAVLAAAIAWALLLPVASFAASYSGGASWWYALAFAVYGIGSFVCHQMPERSFEVSGVQWPVCARCAGIYGGAALAAIAVALGASKLTVSTGSRRTSTGSAGGTSRSRLLLAAAALPTAVSLVYEWTTGAMPSNAVRALAGAPLGAAIVVIIAGVLSLAPPPELSDGRAPVFRA